MARHKRSRQRQAAPQHLLISLFVFITSTIVFVHQCITPLNPSKIRATVANFSIKSIHSTSHDHAIKSPGILPKLEYSRSSIHTRQHGNTPHSAQVSVQQEASRPVSVQTTSQALSSIPQGPFPLPPLAKETQIETSFSASVLSGSSWTASLARKILPSLPLHWFAEAMHTVDGSEHRESESMSASIFRAKRKGDWIGCSRPHHLVCKGVYRAIKATNTLSLLSMYCSRHNAWLPHVLRKLRTELRPVSLTCLLERGGTEEIRADINATYGNVGLRAMELTDVAAGQIRVRGDMLLAYGAVSAGTLIDAMRLFKGVKRSKAAELLIVETFPDVDNVVARSKDGRLRINTGVAPFWFPAPVFEYANEDENAEDIDMEVVAVKVAELFEEHATPEMKDLVDPRKRVVEER